MDFERFMNLIQLSHDTHGTDWIFNRRLLRLRLRELIATEIKNCNLQSVMRSAKHWWQQEIAKNDGNISCKYYPSIMPWDLENAQILYMYLSEHCA